MFKRILIIGAFLPFLSVTPVLAVNYILPVQGSFTVTQGPGGDYSHNEPSTLEAWDLAGNGIPVAVADGEVIKVGWDPDGYGKYVIIHHADGLDSLYGHLGVVSVTQSKPGNPVTVKQGQQIGVIDSTGFSSGDHLHFSLFKNKQPYSTNGLIDFSQLKANIITKAFNYLFPAQGSSSPPAKIDIAPIAGMVSRFYNWALDIAVAVATAIIIWGGVLHISSAGDPAKIKEARAWVKAAIYGLLVLLLGYLILYTVNPCLVGAGTGCA